MALRRILYWFPVALGLLFLFGLAFLHRERSFTGLNDFTQFYTAALLEGKPDLYVNRANMAVIRSLHGGAEMQTPYVRPPFYAAFLKPLALFPYLTAYALFSCVSLASILWFVARFSRETPALPFFAAFGIPLMAAVSDGQDTPFLLPILCAAVLLTRSGRDFAAGVVLSLCAIKFHLFLFVPLFLLLKKRWSIIAGGFCSTVALTVFGMLTEGPDSFLRFLRVLQDPVINPPATFMPNLHGLVDSFHGDPRIEYALVGVVALLFLWATQSTDNFEYLLALSLYCGLLVSFHSGLPDDVLLFAAFVLIQASSVTVPVRVLSGMILTPLPSILFLAGPPYSPAFPLLLLLVLVLACAELVRRPGSVRQTATSGV